jgi:hypothetical protein
MGLSNHEIVMTPGPDGLAPMVIFDLPVAAAGALADAVGFERDLLGSGALESEDILRLRALGDLAERLRPREDGEMAVLRLDADDVAQAADAAEHFLALRDVEAYQAPEDRARIAAVREIVPALRDVQARLMLAGLGASEAALT